MRGKSFKLALALGACLLLPGAAAAGPSVGGAVGRSTAMTLIFGGAADPTYLDPALASDGETFRVTKQIFEGLVELRPGTLRIQPALATSWNVARDGRTWTFNLRRGVRFHDGTAFNAAAVCANFNRWYNFRGPFQDASATFYYQAIFAGFRRNEVSGLGKPLFRSCRAAGQYRAVIRLTRRNGPFLPSLVLSPFAMQSPRAMQRFGANEGTLRNGTFYPTGSYAFRHPTGTGAFRFHSWAVGEKVELRKYTRYWGKKARLDRLIIRPISNNTARLQALQSGDVFGYDLVAPQDIATIKANRRLKVLDRPSFNVGYVTINSAKEPTNKLAVRKAIAYGLDRRRVVRSFYAGRGQVAHEFMPPSLFGYEPKVVKYSYNPTRARTLLRQAGCLPCRIEFWYPTNVSRPYMPDPKRNFEAFKASLEAAGFVVEARSAPWRPDYVKHVNEGTAGNLNLIGWTGDYGDPDNFLGTFFQGFNPQFGERNAALDRLLDAAEIEVNFQKRVALYKRANRLIMQFLPGVPYVHTRPALGFQRRVKGYKASPIGSDFFRPVYIGGQ